MLPEISIKKPENAVDWWEQIVAARGPRTAMIDGLTGRRWTYAEFDRLVQDLAVQLQRLGVLPQEKIVASLRNGPELACLYFACLRIRAIVVPVSPAASLESATYILQTCRPRCIVCEKSTEKLFAAGDTESTTLRVVIGDVAVDNETAWSLDRATSRTLPDAVSASAGDHWVITFTSGTTSKPKGIVHRAMGLLTCAEAFNAAVGIDADTRLYHVFSMTYMAGILNTLVCPFVAGGIVVLGDEFNARSALSFWQAPMSYQVNTFWVAPTVLRLLLKLDREPRAAMYCRDHVRAFHVGTAPLPVELKNEFEARFEVAILESYGLSEVLFVTTNTPSGPRRAGSVGSAIAGVTLRIVDQQGNEAKPGREGEIHVATQHGMVGYLDDVHPFVDGMFATGDLGTLTEEGLLSITGRKKDLIIRGGFNISPQEIEEVLVQHHVVDCAAVLGTPHESYGEEVTAVVQLVPGANLSEWQPALVALCQERLRSICVPTKFLDLGKLPVTVTGKVKKGQLRELIADISRAA